MDNLDRFFVGVGVAVIGFMIKELIVWLFKRSQYSTTLIHDIKDVVEKFEIFGDALRDSPPEFSDSDTGAMLKFRWSDGRQGFDVSFKDVLYVDPVDLGACELFYGAMGRYTRMEEKYNDLIISYSTETDERALCNIKLFLLEIHNSMVAEVDEIVKTGKEALLTLNNCPRKVYRPAK